MPTRYITTDTALTSVADAIRSKGGTSAPLVYPSGFVSAINDIQTGSNGPVVEKDVNFIDYDGTLLYSYTKEEIQAMTNENELPANPTHTGLTAQGWNWTLAQIKAQLTAMPTQSVYVGQMYVTTSGDTEVDIEINDDSLLDPALSLGVDGSITIDWGDNTTLDTVTGDSTSTKQEVQHIYTSIGNYTIKIHVTNGEFTPYGTSSVLFFLRYNSGLQESYSYISCVKNIRLGNGITVIGGRAFYYCYELRTITIPNSVINVISSAFYHCRKLLCVVLPNEITGVNSNLFSYCYGLKYVSLPSSITFLGNSAFSYCQSLSNITLPSSVTTIESSVFTYCYSLLSITIPGGVTTLSDSVCSYCYALSNVTFLNGITKINNSAFSYCYSIVSVTLPNSITTIQSNVFSNCLRLTEITLSNALKSIGDSAFNGCFNLLTITFPNSLTSIGKNAFTSCYSLTSITIPSEVASIGNSAFNSCYGVAKYHITPTTVPTAGTTIFNNIKSYTVIYVPSGKLTEYQAANGWSTYSSYMQAEPAS